MLFIATLLLGASASALAQSPSPVDIANFALNLEYLEATFYSYAAFGKGLSEEDCGGKPDVVGGRKADLSPAVAAYAKEIAEDEIAHVRFLRSALGDAAVPCPKIDIGPAFQAAAIAAAGAKDLSPTFDPYANDIFFLHAAYIFEDVGVTAYVGALPALQDSPLVAAAGNLGSVEAYHAGVVRTLLAQLSFPETCYGAPTPGGYGGDEKAALDVSGGTETPYGVTVPTLLQLISDLRDNADGNPDNQDEGIVKDGELNVVPVDANGLAYTRSAAEVLRVVYLTGDETMPGGFYPEGISTAE